MIVESCIITYNIIIINYSIKIKVRIILLALQCSGAFCQTGPDTLLQQFEVVSSVSFIDASTGPAVILAEDPGFEDKLANDFFYPFW